MAKGVSEYVGISVLMVAMTLFAILAMEWTTSVREEYARTIEEIQQSKEVLYVYTNGSDIVVVNGWGRVSDIVALIYVYPTHSYVPSSSCSGAKIIEDLGLAIQRIDDVKVFSSTRIPLDPCLTNGMDRICVVTVYGNVFCSQPLYTGIDDTNTSEVSDRERSRCSSSEALALLARLLPPDRYASIVSKYCVKDFEIVKPFQGGEVNATLVYRTDSKELSLVSTLYLANTSTSSLSFSTDGNHSGCVPVLDGKACIGWDLETFYSIRSENRSSYVIYNITVKSVLSISIAVKDDRYTLLLYFDLGLSPLSRIPRANSICGPSACCRPGDPSIDHNLVLEPSRREWVQLDGAGYPRYVITKEFRATDELKLNAMYSIRRSYAGSSIELKLRYDQGLGFFDESRSSLGYVVIFLLEEK